MVWVIRWLPENVKSKMKLTFSSFSHKIASICLSLLILLVFCCSCTGNENLPKLGEEYNLETDYPVSFFEGAGGPFVAPAPDGYYFFIGRYLYYLDKETKTAVPLCNKPECRHAEETDISRIPECNAYFYVDESPFLQYYEGDIYIATQCVRSAEDPTICNILTKVSADGTVRTNLCPLDRGEYFSYAIHRGYLYSYMLSSEGECTLSRVQMQNLNGEKEVLYKDFSFVFSFRPLFYGNHLYLNHMEIGEDEAQFVSQIWDYDLSTGNRNAVFGEDGITATGYYRCMSLYQDQMLLGASFDSAAQYYLYDPQTQEKRFLTEYIAVDDMRYAMRSDRNTLYEYTQKGTKEQMHFKLTCKDTNEKTVLQLETDEIPPYMALCPGDERYIFILASDVDFNYGFYLIDKNDSQSRLVEVVTLTASQAFPPFESFPIISDF